MKTDLEQHLQPNLPFLRKWSKTHKHENHVAEEMEKCLLYVRYLQDRVEQLELYNECFKKIIKEDS